MTAESPGRPPDAPETRPEAPDEGRAVESPIDAAARRYEAVSAAFNRGEASGPELVAAAQAFSAASEAERRARALARTEEFRPPHAPHVLGRYGLPTIDPETRMPEPVRVECVCERCGARWQTLCASGRTREHVMRFGSVHLHADPLGTKAEP